jgi:hypothetical protein
VNEFEQNQSAMEKQMAEARELQLAQEQKSRELTNQLLKMMEILKETKQNDLKKKERLAQRESEFRSKLKQQQLLAAYQRSTEKESYELKLKELSNKVHINEVSSTSQPLTNS